MNINDANVDSVLQFVMSEKKNALNLLSSPSVRIRSTFRIWLINGGVRYVLHVVGILFGSNLELQQRSRT